MVAPISPPFDVNGIVSTGQSLSVGNQGTPLLSNVQPFSNIVMADLSAQWQPNHAYASGAFVYPTTPTGRVYQAQGAGTSAGTEPNPGSGNPWPTVLNATVVDGGVTWKLVGNGGGYNIAYPTSPSLAVIPAVADWRGGGSQGWPNNINGEDPATTAINALTALALYNRYSSLTLANILVGVTGSGIAAISRGGGQVSYAAARFEAQYHKARAVGLGKTFGIPAILLTHGEFDATSTTYAADVKTLYDQFAADLVTDTGQGSPAPMFLTQQNTTPLATGTAAVSSAQQLLAHTSYPGQCILVGPKYQLPYVGTPGQHLTNVGYRQLGELYARAVWKQVFLGQTWEPLRPTAFAVAGAVVTMTFAVPTGALVFDATKTAPHASGTFSMWANGKGFEASDITGNLTIASVALQGSNQVVLTLSAPPSTGLAISYAYTSDSVAGSFAGPGRGGLLRDQASFLTTTDLSPITGSRLPNWCVSFPPTVLT